MRKPLFVAFEGLDGSGNTTQSRLLVEFLKSKGRDVVLTKEPTTGEIGSRIREVLRKRTAASPMELQRMFVEDREQHLQSVIEPALAAGKDVVTDRYMFSTMAFGGIHLSMDMLREMNAGFRVPDLTFVIDVSAEVSMERVRRRMEENGAKRLELFEDPGKLKLVRENYLKVARLYPNVHVIDGDRTIEDVAKDVRAEVLHIMEREADGSA